jgi:hypothetical protein
LEAFSDTKAQNWWQTGYFDHRLRADERGEQLSAKMNYIQQNPVAAGLCAKAENWPWFITAGGSSAPPLDANNVGEAE